MSKENTAESLLKDVASYLGLSKTETVEETVEMAEETKEEVKEETEVKFASELAEGEYELKDGTMFRIDAEGNVVDVQAPSEEEAETEEADKEAEDMGAKENLEESKLSEETTKELEELKAQVAELSATKPISNAPQKTVSVQMEITPGMTYKQRVMAKTYNALNK
jgi:hypothetical protein